MRRYSERLRLILCKIQRILINYTGAKQNRHKELGVKLGYQFLDETQSPMKPRVQGVHQGHASKSF